MKNVEFQVEKQTKMRCANSLDYGHNETTPQQRRCEE